jgi:hypothetical protein
MTRTAIGVRHNFPSAGNKSSARGPQTGSHRGSAASRYWLLRPRAAARLGRSQLGTRSERRGAVAGHTRPDPGHRRIQRDPAFTGFLRDPSGLAFHVITPLSGRHTGSKQQSSRCARRRVRPRSCRPGVGEQTQARFRHGTSSGRSGTKPPDPAPTRTTSQSHLITKQHIITHLGRQFATPTRAELELSLIATTSHFMAHSPSTSSAMNGRSDGANLDRSRDDYGSMPARVSEIWRRPSSVRTRTPPQGFASSRSRRRRPSSGRTTARCPRPVSRSHPA